MIPPTPYYDENGITLYHGDCREILPSVARRCDLLLTDPPYGMNYKAVRTTAQASVAGDGARQGVRLVRQMLREVDCLLADEAHVLMFCHWESWPDFYDALSPYAHIRNALIWHKATGGMGNVRTNYLRDYEVILYAARGKRAILGDGPYSNVLTGFSRLARRGHPTEKPGDLLRHLIRRHAPAGGHILDPFMGSGSGVIAARAEGMTAVGIEVEERYCEMAATRLAAGNADLFGGAA